MFATHPKNRGAGGDILGETDSSGNTLNEYIFFGGKRIALVPGTPAPNGGFEQGLQNWNTWGTGAQVITDPARAHSGNNYLQVSTSTNGGVTSTAMIPVTPGQQITFGGWVYRESGTSGAASWNIVVYWSNQTVDGYLSSGNVTSASWTYQTYTYTIPPGVGYVQLYAQVYGASSATTARFDDGFVSFGTAATSGPLFYVEDSLGTSRVITTSTGIVCYDADFYPFGGERPYTNTCPQNYKFEGKERDPETGNDDFGARYYSNRFGRWLSSDWSAVPAPVPYANLTNPQTLNLYAMVADDPESFADLDGHSFTQTYQVAPGGWGADMMGGTDFWVNNDTGDVAATSDGSPPPGTPQAQNQNQDQNQQNQQNNQSATQQPATQSGINPNYKLPTLDTVVKKVSDFSAGAGDCLTGRCLFLGTSLTEKARQLNGADSVVDKGSGAYLGGKVTGAVVGTGIASLAVANAAVGLESKVAIHGAHHAFEFLGGARLAHIQVILWIAGQKGSDLSLRIPLPWK